MNESINKNGRLADETVRLSQELDLLIVKEMMQYVQAQA